MDIMRLGPISTPMEAYIVRVDAEIRAIGEPRTVLWAVLADTPEKAAAIVRAETSLPGSVTALVAGEISQETIDQLGLKPGHARKL